MSSLEHGVFGHQGVIGADFGLACGFAMVAKWRKTGQVIVCGFGDGASNQGRFHEAANFAAVNNLPVLFVCVNNHYATSMPVWKSVATENIAERARGYGIRGETFDGNDAVEAHLAALSAVEHVRSGAGPAMLEYKTFRLSGQSIADSGDYLDQDRLAYYRGRDPLTLFQERARKEQWFGDEELIAIDREALQAAEAAFVFADASPLPDPAELEDNDELGPPPAVAEAAGNQPDTPPESGRRLTYAAAISEAQRQAMEADPNVYVIGEDIGVFGGHGGPTRGLIERFGDQRVIDTPIIEGTFTGAAIATSVMGYRPIVDEGMMSYMMPAIDETANVLANSRYVSGDQYTLPVTVRTNLAGGGGPSFGATNTQSWHAWFQHVPNLKIAMPATPYDAKGLLLTSIADESSVLFIEHRLLYSVDGVVPEDPYFLPLGKSLVRRGGDDVTLLAMGITVGMALDAAAVLGAKGISVEIIDARSLKPFDYETLLTSLSRTRRLVIADVGYETGGVGDAILAELIRRKPGLLTAAASVASLNRSIPMSPALTEAFFPSTARIAATIQKMMTGV